MDLRPSARQQELMDRARDLALTRFAGRAAETDRNATFPFKDFEDLRDAGFLGLCVPEEYGGLGGDFETYCLVSSEIARGNGSTALCFNMHCLTMLMMGELSVPLEMSAETRKRHEALSAKKFTEVVERGVFYGQPHSEPVEEGETDSSLPQGGRRFGTTAEKVDGGYVINGRKFFVSLSDAAPYFATPCILSNSDAPWIERTLYLKVPRNADGVTFSGDWDPIGMRGTVSRNMVLKDVFVPDDAEILPAGGFGRLFQVHAHGPLSFTATFLGIMQQAYDIAVQFLTGTGPGMPGKGEISPIVGQALAEIEFTVEATQALYWRSISEAKLPPTTAIRQRARAAHVTVQRNAVAVTQESMRICGGRGLLKQYPLERYARDAHAASVMRPWTEEAVIADSWRSILAAARRAAETET